MFIDHVIKQNGLGKMLIRGKVKGKRSERRPTVSEEILDHIQTTTNLPLPEFIRTCNNKKNYGRWASKPPIYVSRSQGHIPLKKKGELITNGDSHLNNNNKQKKTIRKEHT